jgi:hypothetical protein
MSEEMAWRVESPNTLHQKVQQLNGPKLAARLAFFVSGAR